MSDTIIRCGNYEHSFMALVAPLQHDSKIFYSQFPLSDEQKSFASSFFGMYLVRHSSVKAVCDLFEDFLLNTHQHIPAHCNFFGLRSFAKKKCGRDVNPLLTIPADDPTFGNEIYPGLYRFRTDQCAFYAIEESGSAPVMLYLPT